MIFFRKEHPFLFSGSCGFFAAVAQIILIREFLSVFQVTSLSLVFSSLSGFSLQLSGAKQAVKRINFVQTPPLYF